MNDPRKSHLTAAKRILRYVKGTLKFGLLFPAGNKEGETELEGYSDSDWCGDRMDRRSTSSYLFKLNGAAISWCTKKQPVTVYLHVKLSTLQTHLQHVKQFGLTM